MRRTKVYIAADWTGDSNAIDQLHYWNDSESWSLSFPDAHEMTQAKDDSLNCNIKKSLSLRLNASKTFVLIVGNKTKYLAAGSCRYCQSYNSWGQFCARGGSVDYRSYLQFECEKALRDGLKIVVLYNGPSVDKDKCPDILRSQGMHVSMWYKESVFDKRYKWNYHAVKNAIGD